MSELKLRNGKIDLAILAGPGVQGWPTAGARTLARVCASAGLKVGWYGGAGMKVRGVLAHEHSGAVVFVEDAQSRVHRIQAKSVVKIVSETSFPLPFEGWYSPGLIPEGTARKLVSQGQLNWQPVVGILGTGNRALDFASNLIQSKVASRVVCIESVYDQVQGWEVEKRRFEVLGGRIVFGKPEVLIQKAPFLWELKVRDSEGTRVLDLARLISIGPFHEDSGFREYPAGSYLFEWENYSYSAPVEDVQQALLEEHRAIVLAAKIIRGVSSESGRTQIDKLLWQSKTKLKELESWNEHRFEFQYDGKWLSEDSKKSLHEFPGTLKTPVKGKILASIECLESIGCRECESVCPADAIDISRLPDGSTQSFLKETNCTGCGFCLQVCPSQVPVMIQGDASESFTPMIFPFREILLPKAGDRVSLLNRKGQPLVQTKVLDLFLDGEVPLIRVEVPSHLIWEARGLVHLEQTLPKEDSAEVYSEGGQRVEVQIQGKPRRVREGQSISVALFENGIARSNDILVCEDGSCGLCEVEVDGVKKFACQEKIHQGMAIRFARDEGVSSALCPCTGMSVSELSAKVKSTNPETPEAFLSMAEVTQGRCHGMICQKPWLKLAEGLGVKNQRFVDWSFPWSDWTFR